VSPVSEPVHSGTLRALRVSNAVPAYNLRCFASLREILLLLQTVGRLEDGLVVARCGDGAVAMHLFENDAAIRFVDCHAKV
jgi:hypothetical protein